MASSTTRIPRTRAGWMASGACISGSTAHRAAATRTDPGGAGAMSTGGERGHEFCDCAIAPRHCGAAAPRQDRPRSFPPRERALEVRAVLGGERPVDITARTICLDLGARLEQLLELIEGVADLRPLVATFRAL